MTARHQSPEYRKNARIIRAQTKRLDVAMCIRCHGPIFISEGEPFDVGHIIDGIRGGSNALSNLGPQHRKENRRDGGRLGAETTNRGKRRERRLGTW